MQIVYFTLNQGIDKLMDKGEVISKREKLKIIRNKIRGKFKAEGFITDNNIVIGNKFYEEGAIFHKEYKKDNLPDEAQIKAYFICLDEMNLAKVEYYLSHFISATEIREFDNGEYKTAPLLEKGFLPKENEYSELSIPDNLYLIGTVNISDSTAALNEKVIDRANIIELTEVDFEYEDYIGEPVNSTVLGNDLLKKSFRTNDDAMKLNKDYVKLINKKCTEINSILMPFNKHFAYRVKFEVVSYMLENKISGIFDEEKAFDYQIAQRILPKIELDGIKRKDLLIALYEYCAEGVKLNTTGDYILEAKQNLNNSKYIKSATKITKMLEGGRYGFS